MGAGAAGQGGGGTGPAAGDGGGEGQGEAALNPADVMAQFASLQEGQEELRQFIQQQQAPETDPLAEPDPEFDFSFLEQFAGPDGLDGEQQQEQQAPGFDPAQFAQQFGEQVQRAVDARVAPIEQQQQQMEYQRGVEALAAEFPDLGQPEVLQDVAQATSQYAEIIGQPELATQPAFMRLIYMAGRAADLANDEAGDAPGVAHIEGGGGAGAGGGQQMNMADVFSGGPKGSGVLPFR